MRPPLGEQRVHRVHHVRPAQQPGPAQLPYDGGRFAVPAAHRLGQQPAYGAGVASSATASARARGDRGHRHARDLLRARAARRRGRAARSRSSAAAGCAGTRTSIRSRDEQRRRGGEAVQGQRRQPGDHRLAVRRAVRLRRSGLRGTGRRPRRRTAARACSRSSLVGGPGWSRYTPGQQLLPGAAGPALLGRLARRRHRARAAARRSDTRCAAA